MWTTIFILYHLLKKRIFFRGTEPPDLCSVSQINPKYKIWERTIRNIYFKILSQISFSTRKMLMICYQCLFKITWSYSLLSMKLIIQTIRKKELFFSPQCNQYNAKRDHLKLPNQVKEYFEREWVQVFPPHSLSCLNELCSQLFEMLIWIMHKNRKRWNSSSSLQLTTEGGIINDFSISMIS